MCDPVTLTVVATAATGAFSAYSQYQQGAAQNKMYQYQADTARQEGDAAIKRGQTQAELIQDSAKADSVRQAQGIAQLSASQKAALAANGVDLSSVTAQDISLDTAHKGNMDEIAIRHNADLESWSAQEDAKNKNWQSQNQANQFAAAGKNAKRAGARNAFGTLLGTAAQIGMSGAFKAAPTTKATSSNWPYGK